MEGATTAMSSIEWSTLVTAITSAVTANDLLALFGIVLGAGIVYAMTWFGARVIVSGISSAIKRGRISIGRGR